MSDVTKLPLIISNNASIAAAARKPAARKPAARRRRFIWPPAVKPRLTEIIRECLTVAAVAGLMWFQWEIIRCCW